MQAIFFRYFGFDKAGLPGPVFPPRLPPVMPEIIYRAFLPSLFRGARSLPSPIPRKCVGGMSILRLFSLPAFFQSQHDFVFFHTLNQFESRLEFRMVCSVPISVWAAPKFLVHPHCLPRKLLSDMKQLEISFVNRTVRFDGWWKLLWALISALWFLPTT